MPRIRTIKPEFWYDEQMAEVPLEARLLFIGTWNLADDQGVLKGNPRWIKSQLFPYDDNITPKNIENWVEKLVEKKMLVPIFYELDKFLIIRTFSQHQVIDRPSKTLVLPAEKISKYLNLNFIPKNFVEYSEIISRIIGEYSESDKRIFAVGKGKGKGKGGEKEGKDPEKNFSVFSEKNGTEIGIEKKPEVFVKRAGVKSVVRKKNPEVEPFQEVYLSTFAAAWLEKRKTKFKWQPKDFATIKKISKIIRSDHPDWTEQAAREEFSKLLTKSYSDTFIAKNNYENFTLQNVLYRINSIISNQNFTNGKALSANSSVGKTIEFDRP